MALALAFEPPVLFASGRKFVLQMIKHSVENYCADDADGVDEASTAWRLLGLRFVPFFD